MQKSMLRLLSVADFISILNAIFGIFAILVLFLDLIESVELRVHISLSLILLGLLADGLDGIVARKTRKSKIGEYLESMADMTSMVVAPAVLVLFVYSDVIAGNMFNLVYLIIALVLFLFFGIVRLASFNIMKEKNIYVGLPVSASAIIILIFTYLKIDFILILPAVVIIGATMATEFIFPKPGIRINGVALILIILTIIFGKTYYSFAPLLLLAAILFYAIVGPIYKQFSKKSQ